MRLFSTNRAKKFTLICQGENEVLLQRIRLVTGLILFAFVLTHLLNHIVLIFSIDAAESIRTYRSGFWRLWPFTLLFYGALITHMSLTLYKLTQRRTLKMTIWEACQLALGLITPWILLTHIVRTRLTHEFLAVDDHYVYELVRLWPNFQISQSLLVILVWSHAVIGLYYWLRLKPWFARWRDPFMMLALLIPTLALVGFMVGGRATEVLEQNPEWVAELKRTTNWPDDAGVAWQMNMMNWLQYGWVALFFLALTHRQLRLFLLKLRSAPLIEYTPNKLVPILPGATLLEISRHHGFPHASVCGGRGRCSTCRVRVNRGGELLEPPRPDETEVLQRVHAAPNVRLACQVRPVGPISVTPLLPPRPEPSEAYNSDKYRNGLETNVCVMFADLRGYTKMSEGRLPFDVVFILNEYFRLMGGAIVQNNGRIDKFIGDGIMALFGLETDGRTACRQALAAAKDMKFGLGLLNESLQHDLKQPLKMGIGLHFGPVIVGRMGHGETMGLTAIGDIVNAAARLEAATKDFDAELLVSSRVLNAAEWQAENYPRATLLVKGKSENIEVAVIDKARDLPLEATLLPGK